MKTAEDLVWRSESHKRNERIILFLIRLVELFAASCIPSVIGVVLVFMNPDVRIMRVMNIISFVAFGCINVLFWMKYVRQRANRVEFYVMNGLVYAIYALMSAGLYKFGSQLMYSVLFSDLRGLEIFCVSTLVSLAVSHGIMVSLMVACEIFSRRHYAALLQKLAENGADEVEMDMWGDRGPIRQNENIKTLSVEEMYSAMEAEQIDAAKDIADKLNGDEDIWDKSMYKGRGESIRYIEAENLDNDIDDKDYIVTGDTEDSLWNEEIYKGRKPIYDYPEETEEYVKPAVAESDEEDEVSLWDKSMRKGRGEKIESFSGDEAYDVIEVEDAPESGLWASNMYQGRKKRRLRKDNIDKILKRDAQDELLEKTPMGDYDSDNLWNSKFEGREASALGDIPDEADLVRFNEFEKYDWDNLWDTVEQGK